MLTSMTEIYSDPANIEALKQMVPDYKPEDMIAMLSQITFSQLTLNFLVINSFLAIVLSLPTAFVARVKNVK